MSLKDGTYGVGLDDITNNGIESEITFEGGLLDAFLDRMTQNSVQGPAFPPAQMNGQKQGAESGIKEVQANSNLQRAFKNVQGVQNQTVKLQENKITSESGQGARRSGNDIQAKGQAVKEMKSALNEVKAANPSGGNAPSGGGMGMKVAKSLAVGAAVDMVVPGAGAAMTIAAIGAGTFGAKNSKTEFTSASEKGGESVYSSSAGHDRVDIVPGGNSVGQAFDAQMSQGAGFGGLVGRIGGILEPGLDGITTMTFDEEQIAELEAMVSEMDQDFKMGNDMFQKWKGSTVDVTASIGKTSMDELKLDANKAWEAPPTMNAATLS